MKKYLFLVCYVWIWSSAGYAQSALSDAAALYDDAKYKEAAELYRQVGDEYPASPGVWYNLGNAYYKSGKTGYAIAAYRKALKLSPMDEDIRYNLDFAVSKSSDKIEPAPRSFIVRQTDRAADLFTAGGWAAGTVVCAAAAFMFFLLYIFIREYRIKKIGLGASALCWVLAFVCLALAAHRYYYALDSYAVVVAKSADVLGEPTGNGTRLLLLGEGATLKLVKEEGAWIEVQLPDGSKGYVPAEKVQVI